MLLILLILIFIGQLINLHFTFYYGFLDLLLSGDYRQLDEMFRPKLLRKLYTWLYKDYLEEIQMNHEHSQVELTQKNVRGQKDF